MRVQIRNILYAIHHEPNNSFPVDILPHLQSASPYALLNVHQYSSRDTIQASYLRLAHQFHPDTQREKSDIAVRAEIFKLINNANAILSNDEEKRKYDATCIDVMTL